MKLGAWLAYASGAAAAVGVPMLIAMYTVLLRSGKDDPAVYRFGALSDVCVLAQYALAVPVAITLHRRNRVTDARLSFYVSALAVSSMIAIAVLQALLLAGVMEFEEQVIYVAIAMLLLIIWFVVVGRLGRENGLLSGRTTLMSILGASYFGFPIWAFWMGHELSRAASEGFERSGRKPPVIAPE